MESHWMFVKHFWRLCLNGDLTDRILTTSPLRRNVLNDSGTRAYRTTNFFPQDIPWQKKFCSNYQSTASFIENKAYEDCSLHSSSFPVFPISYGLWENSTRTKEYSCTPLPQLLNDSAVNLVSARRQSMEPESAAPTCGSTWIQACYFNLDSPTLFKE